MIIMLANFFYKSFAPKQKKSSYLFLILFSFFSQEALLLKILPETEGLPSNYVLMPIEDQNQ